MKILSDEALNFLPPGFAEALEQSQPDKSGKVLVKVNRKDIVDEVKGDIEGYGFQTYDLIEAPGLIVIPTYLPLNQVSKVAELPSVEKVYYNQPRVGQQLPLPPTPYLPPISFNDPLYGKIGITRDVEINGVPLLGAWMYLSAQLKLPSEPTLAVHDGIAKLARSLNLPAAQSIDVGNVVATDDSRKMIGAPEDNKVENTRVAVLDTGAVSEPHPLWRKPQNKVSYTGEGPDDLIGHGSWVETAAFGKEAPTQYGKCKGVADVNGDNTFIAKVLSNIGFGSTEFVLRGMAYACDRGAEVVNMSLGGAFDNSIEDNPENEIIEATKDDTIWCVAAGNSGPDFDTIGSPGISPHALTVGSISVEGDVSEFSSRGPSSGWYAKHQSVWDRDYATYGEDMIKPDLVAPGGDTGELIYSACQGWMDSSDDMLINSLNGLKGTSMATPHVAGLCAILKEEGKIRNAGDVKDVMRKEWGIEKDFNVGYGLIKYEFF